LTWRPTWPADQPAHLANARLPSLPLEVFIVSNATARLHAGLEMIVNIDQDNYVKDAGETAGIRLVVHSGDRIPFPEDEGITVSPGHSTSIGMQKVRTCRSVHPR